MYTPGYERYLRMYTLGMVGYPLYTGGYGRGIPCTPVGMRDTLYTPVGMRGHPVYTRGYGDRVGIVHPWV